MQNDNEKVSLTTDICDNLYTLDCSLKDLGSSEMQEISIVSDGCGVHKIINQTIPCKKGDVFVINSNVPHKYFTTNADDKMTVISIRFDPKKWFNGKISDRDDNRFCYGIFSENAIVTYAMLNSKTMKEILNLFNIIKSELDLKQREWNTAVSANLGLFDPARTERR